MRIGREFDEKVRAAAEGTPYAVTETDDGFDVALDIVDAQWYGLLNKAGLHRTWTHHVKLDDDGAYSITDQSQTVEWVAGAPRIAGSIEVTKGRAIEFGKEKIWAFDEHGRFGTRGRLPVRLARGARPDRGHRASTSGWSRSAGRPNGSA